MASPADASGASPATLERVLEVVAALAREVGGHRAAGAVAPAASLERDVGLGSLERVELLSRLEKVFGRQLDDQCLRLDTAEELARAVAGEVQQLRPPAPETGAPLAAARRLDRPALTVHESLWRRAEAEPDRPHVYLREDDGRELTVSYGALLEEARAVAGGLRERGIQRGDAVALMLPTGLDFLRSFQGILIAGAIPVPIYPPVRLDRIEEYALRQSGILADAGAVALLTIARAWPVAALLKRRLPALAHVLTPDELASPGSRYPAPEGTGGDAAFIQYTSGSTGQPKGVLLSHANLLANIRAIGLGLGVRPTDVGVSWLPLYHDMGLIGTWLFCMHEGLPLDLQSPLSFLARPERWLWAIHRRRGTLSAAPNFAYELCVRKVPEDSLAGLDLSSWRCALNGAEPVHPDTLERFARRFGPYGFRREALLPVYGLAECSVGLCFPPVGRGPLVDRVERGAFESLGRAEPAPADDRTALRFVSVGSALPEHEVRILDEQGQPVAERSVGRLVFRGPSMTTGYFRKPEATAAIRVGDFLDSGDLAYHARDEIYIAGRSKDLIITAGRNLVPQEIEEVAAGAQGVRKGCVVAVGVAHESLGTEVLVVVAETRESEAAARDRIAAEITERVAEAVGVPPDRVVLVEPGTVPKTSSGKIRRAATRELLRSGALGRPQRTPLARRAHLVGTALLYESRLWLRRLGRLVYGVYLALLLAPTASAAWLLAALVPSRRLARLLEHGYCRLALKAAGVSVEATGQHQLEQAAGAVIFACNHASYADIPALLAWLPPRFAFVAKREVRNWPLIGTFVRRAGHLTVERWQTAQSAADSEQIRSAVEGGDSVLVFPEGTFTAAAGLRPFRLGAFKAAVETGTAIIPLALGGTRGILRDGAWIPRPARVRLWIGAPMRPTGRDWAAVVELRDRVASAIAAECGEPRLDLLAGAPPRPAP